jgi:hypothetical protein
LADHSLYFLLALLGLINSASTALVLFARMLPPLADLRTCQKGHPVSAEAHTPNR